MLRALVFIAFSCVRLFRGVVCVACSVVCLRGVVSVAFSRFFLRAAPLSRSLAFFLKVLFLLRSLVFCRGGVAFDAFSVVCLGRCVCCVYEVCLAAFAAFSCVC